MAWINCENLLLKQTSTCSELVLDIASFGIVSGNLVKDNCSISGLLFVMFLTAATGFLTTPPHPTQTLILLGDWTEGKGDFLKRQSLGGKTRMRNKHWDPYIIYIKTLWNCHMGHHWAHPVFLICVCVLLLFNERIPRQLSCFLTT